MAATTTRTSPSPLPPRRRPALGRGPRGGSRRGTRRCAAARRRGSASCSGTPARSSAAAAAARCSSPSRGYTSPPRFAPHLPTSPVWSCSIRRLYWFVSIAVVFVDLELCIVFLFPNFRLTLWSYSALYCSFSL
jgi:hypothetical protein